MTDAPTIRLKLAVLRELDPAAAAEVDATWVLTLAGLDRPADELLLERTHGFMRRVLDRELDELLAGARDAGHLPGVPS